MTPEQIALVQASVDQLGTRLSAVAAQFYRELFARNPELRSLFTTDPAIQEVRFAEKLTAIVAAMPSLGDFLGHTQALGARHVGYGVRAGDYRAVGEALLAALAVTLGEAFDPATRQAWSVAYNLMAETMLDGAAAARPIRT